MKKVLAVACLLLLCLGSAVSAAEDSWRISIKADNGFGGAVGPALQIGVSPTPTDPTDPANMVNYLTVPQDACLAVALIPPYPYTYVKYLQAPGPPPKVWELRVAGMPMATGDLIRLLWYTAGSTVLPPTSVGGIPAGYKLTMVDNRGKAGAPANGTEWLLPTPTVHSTSPYYTGPTFPMLRLTEASHQAMINQGYALEFWQYVVPEPGSLLVLGTGLIALAGLIPRRRKR